MRGKCDVPETKLVLDGMTQTINLVIPICKVFNEPPKQSARTNQVALCTYQ